MARVFRRMEDDLLKSQFEDLIRRGEQVIEDHFAAQGHTIRVVEEDGTQDELNSLVDQFLTKCDEIGHILMELSLWAENGTIPTVVKPVRKPGQLHLPYLHWKTAQLPIPRGGPDPGQPTDSRLS